MLLIGVGGLGAEVAKNIVLAGVRSLTLLDDQNVCNVVPVHTLHFVVSLFTSSELSTFSQWWYHVGLFVTCFVLELAMAVFQLHLYTIESVRYVLVNVELRGHVVVVVEAVVVVVVVVV